MERCWLFEYEFHCKVMLGCFCCGHCVCDFHFFLQVERQCCLCLEKTLPGTLDLGCTCIVCVFLFAIFCFAFLISVFKNLPASVLTRNRRHLELKKKKHQQF